MEPTLSSLLARFHVIKAPPFAIFGGRTRWVIQAEYYGKNGGKLALVARCVETAERVAIVDGPTRTVVGMCSRGFTLHRLTKAYQIMKVAARDGFVKMEVVEPERLLGPAPYPKRPPRSPKAEA